MKKFSNFDAFSKQLEKVISKYQDKEFKALNFIGQFLEEEAKEKIGHLQKGGGEFEDWKELADSTKRDKERLGYVFNEEYNPLFRTGKLRDSISHVVNRVNHKLYVGSTDPVAKYQELGTFRIPPRSFLGLTFFKEKLEIQFVLSTFLSNWIADDNSALKRKNHGSL